jgi:hypothetical protein
LSGGNVPLLDSVTTGHAGTDDGLAVGREYRRFDLEGVSGQGNDRAYARRARVQAAPEDGTFWPVS